MSLGNVEEIVEKISEVERVEQPVRKTNSKEKRKMNRFKKIPPDA